MSPTSGHTPLGPGPEFDLVRMLVSRYGAAGSGIGDDASRLSVPAGEELFVSTDVAVEDVHFKAAWLPPEEIGFRSATAALSDIAAMAATPRGLVVALTLSPRWREHAAALADGFARAAGEAGTTIIGGDLSDGGALSIAVTVFGSTTRPLRRAGAAVGDALWVTGTLGGPGAALDAWLSGSTPSAAHRERFAHPHARIQEALWLASRGATAAIDISDGLVADAGHLAAASRARLSIDLDLLPLAAGVRAQRAAESGEEYELLVAAPRRLDSAAFAKEFGIPLTNIGSVNATAVSDAQVLVTQAGAVVRVAGGFDHFRK